MGLVTGSNTLPCISHIFSFLSDESFLQQVGFRVEPLSATTFFKNINLEDPLAFEEQDRAARLGRLVVGVLGESNWARWRLEGEGGHNELLPALS